MDHTWTRIAGDLATVCHCTIVFRWESDCEIVARWVCRQNRSRHQHVLGWRYCTRWCTFSSIPADHKIFIRQNPPKCEE